MRSKFPRLGSLNSGVLKNIVAVSSGRDFTLALGSDGKVYGWGRNDEGQLGNGSASAHYIYLPTVVQKASGGELNNIVSISAGEAHSIAVAADGSVYVWGRDTYGQLGIGTPFGGSPYKASAVQPLSPAGTGILSEILSIAASGNASCAVDTSGSVFAWGLATNGQLGNAPNRPTPVVSDMRRGPLTEEVDSAGSYAQAAA